MSVDSRKVLQKCQFRVGQMGRRILLLLPLGLLLLTAVQGAVVDRIAAVVQSDVITASEVDQMVAMRILPRSAGRSDDDYRHDVLDELVSQALRYRDVERFGS